MTLAVLLASLLAVVASPNCPTGLMSDLVERTGVEYAEGYSATICSSRPTFSWELPVSDKKNIKQEAYRILVATHPSLLKPGATDVWDSDKVFSGQSIAVPYTGGTPLKPRTTYYWKVRVWTKAGASEWSEFRFFRTAAALDSDYSHYPLCVRTQRPVSVKKIARDRYLCDFGLDAFAQPTLLLKSKNEARVTIQLGEKLDKIGFIDQNPGASVRFGLFALDVKRGRSDFKVTIPHDPRNAGKPDGNGNHPVLMPDYVGEVYPFRYMDVEGIKPENIERLVVTYPFNDAASAFSCSDETLNSVWRLCKYSVKATSFTGLYVDGDRDRTPREADALINQLCHYSLDKEYTMARRTADFLLDHAAGPVEAQLQMPLMAWNDLLYTGDARLCADHYPSLVEKCLIALRNPDGLVSIDGAVNTAVNAWHYRALAAMSHIASALGRDDDAARFSSLAAQTASAINSLLFDAATLSYRDGLGSEYHSLHANIYPLAFGIVPEEYAGGVVAFAKSKGMSSSVYDAQFLLDALFDAGEAEYAISLITDRGDRSWCHMMDEGSTITTEAWRKEFKPDMDWNHACGAAPASVVARKMLGIEPLEPGFGAVRIAPRVGKVKSGYGIVPTIRGQIVIGWETSFGKKHFNITIPSGMDAEIHLPGKSEPVRTGSGTYSF